jgi:hypothetical protein
MLDRPKDVANLSGVAIPPRSFLPLPQRQGSLRPSFIDESLTGLATTLSNVDLTESPSSRRPRL